jgi:hypothetical protein
MIILGIDYHDTLGFAPEFFRELLCSWPDPVYIVTGTPASKKEEVTRGLSELGFDGLYEDILCGFEYDKADLDSSAHFQKMREHKLALIKQYNIQVYYDDNPYYAAWMKDHGVVTFLTCMPREYMEREADKWFTSNLQLNLFNDFK